MHVSVNSTITVCSCEIWNLSYFKVNFVVFSEVFAVTVVVVYCVYA
jgi:hypothetical protein